MSPRSKRVQVIGWDGKRLTVKIGNSVFYTEDLTPADPLGLPISTRAQHALYTSRPEWTEEELIHRGLPLYWSKAWLSEQLRCHGVTGLARISPYRRSVLSKWKTIHGITDATEKCIRQAWKSGNYPTHRNLANDLNISEQRVSAAVGQSRRVHSPELDERLAEVAKLIQAGVKTPAQAHRALPHLSYQQVYWAWRRLLDMPEED